MNKVIKMLVLESIHNNILRHMKIATGDKYVVLDRTGHEILSVINGWATNQYGVYIDGKNILSVKWDQSNSKPLTQDQKDMADIINAAKERTDLQENAQTMNARELELAQFLQKSLCSIKH